MNLGLQQIYHDIEHDSFDVTIQNGVNLRKRQYYLL